MQQQFARNTPPSHKDSSPSTAGTAIPIQERLARHIIEQELQQGLPRQVAQNKAVSSDFMESLRTNLFFLFCWACGGFGLFLPGNTRWSPSNIVQAVQAVYIAASILFGVWFLRKLLSGAAVYIRQVVQEYANVSAIRKLKTARSPKALQKSLLHRGIAVPALILHTAEREQRHHVEFAYIDTSGTYQTGTVIVHPTEMAEHVLYTGKNFTLLQSPDNPQEVLPYFLVTDFVVCRVSEMGR